MGKSFSNEPQQITTIGYLFLGIQYIWILHFVTDRSFCIKMIGATCIIGILSGYAIRQTSLGKSAAAGPTCGRPRPLTTRGMSAWPYRVTPKYSFYPVRTHKMLDNCHNCALKWEIPWFDSELFIHTWFGVRLRGRGCTSTGWELQYRNDTWNSSIHKRCHASPWRRIFCVMTSCNCDVKGLMCRSVAPSSSRGRQRVVMAGKG